MLPRHLLVLLVCVVVPAIADAQPIHGHPQKAAYASPAEWPTVSAQAHWAPSDNPAIVPNVLQPLMDLTTGTFGTSRIGHTHVDLKCPLYAEVSGPFVCNFAIKLFHLSGHVVLDRYESIRNIVYDATGSTTAPVMEGDPHGLKIWTGHLTIDPTMPGTHAAPPHGWFAAIFTALTVFDNGDMTIANLLFPLYSTIDPTVPEVEYPRFGRLASYITSSSIRHPEIIWGVTIIEINQFIPLAPIFAPWAPLGEQMMVVAASYGDGGNAPFGAYEQRVDLDPHNGNPGRLLSVVVEHQQILTPLLLDPAVLGSGTHKVATTRFQSDINGEMVGSLMVFDVVVGAGQPPPPVLCQDPTATNIGAPLPCVFAPPQVLLCQDPAATNLGQPLPCVYPMPSTTDWRSIVPWFEEQFVNGVAQTTFRFCVSATRCFALPAVPR